MEDIQVYYYIPQHLLRNENKIENLVRKGDKTNNELLVEINQTDKFCRDEKSITLKHFRGLINNDISLYAMHEGRIIGILSFMFNQNPQKQKFIVFDGICSPEIFKRLGVGRKLIETLIMIAERNGCHYIKLECKGSVMMYYRDKFGFKVVNETRSAVDSDDDSEDEGESYYYMVLELKPINTELGGKRRNKKTKRNKKNKRTKKRRTKTLRK
jgi:hypothetical protein